MPGIKEVEMVDSVDDLKSSTSIRGRRFPNFEMLDVRKESVWQSKRLNWMTDFSVEDRLLS